MYNFTDTFISGGGRLLLSTRAPDMGDAWTRAAGSATNMNLNPTNQRDITSGSNVGYTSDAAAPGREYSPSFDIHDYSGASNEQRISIRKKPATSTLSFSTASSLVVSNGTARIRVSAVLTRLQDRGSNTLSVASP